MAVTFPLQVVFQGKDRMSGPLSRAGASLQGFGRAATSIGRQLTLGVTAPVVGLGAAAIRTAGGFEAGMNRVQALLGEVSEEAMPALIGQARELGSTTAFSARQAAEGMGFLAQAGFNAQQIMDAMPGTLALAAAGQLDLAEAADIASNVVTGSGLAIAQTGRVVDVLAATSSKANTNVTQLGEALKIAGPIAAGMGIEIEEVAATLGALGNAGFQASLAGTSMRGALSRLANPATDALGVLVRLGIHRDELVDIEGNVLGLANTVALLEQRGASTADLLTIFGDRAGPAMAALVGQGAGEIVRLREELEQAGGTAQRIADIQMQGAAGATARLTSSFEGLLIAVADSGLLESFTDLANRTAGWLGEVSETNPELLRMGSIVLGVSAAVGPLALGVGFLATVLFGTVIPAVWGFTAALLANPITWFVAAVGLLGYGLYKLANSNTVVGDAILATWNGIVSGVQWAVGMITDLADDAFEMVPEWVRNLISFSPGGQLLNFITGPGDLFDPNDRPADPAAISSSESVRRTEGTVRLELGGLPPGARVSTEGDLTGLDLEVGPAMLGGV